MHRLIINLLLTLHFAFVELYTISLLHLSCTTLSTPLVKGIWKEWLNVGLEEMSDLLYQSEYQNFSSYSG